MNTQLIVKWALDLVSNDHAIHECVGKCREEIQAYVDTGQLPSPKNFERVALLSRKEKNYSNEIAICEMYLDLIKEYSIVNNLTHSEIEKTLLPIAQPIKLRLHDAKALLSEN